MARVADYIIIQDGSSAMVGNLAYRRNFKIPSNTHLGSRAILSFVVRDVSDADDLKVVIKINGTNVGNLKYNSDVHPDRTLQEVIKHSLLLHGDEEDANKLEFVVSGDGTVTISDVVLWIQVNT